MSQYYYIVFEDRLNPELSRTYYAQATDDVEALKIGMEKIKAATGETRWMREGRFISMIPGISAVTDYERWARNKPEPAGVNEELDGDDAGN